MIVAILNILAAAMVIFFSLSAGSLDTGVSDADTAAAVSDSGESK